MPTSREGPPGPGGSGGTDAPTGTDGSSDAPPDVRPELAGTRPGYSSSDTDAFARTELIGSKPPELRTPVGTPVEPLADTTVDGREDVHPGAIDAAAREAERRQRQIEGLRSGTQIGRFTVLDVIGAGGMGVVLVAYDSKLDRKIAIKMLHDDVSEGHGPRLEREAKAMAQLSHPNVVTVHETGTWEGRLYIAMEYVEGETLAEMLRNKAPAQRVVLDLMLQAGRGLAAAHEVGLVHRDFKPDNVLVGKDGRARVSDFGLVSEVGGAGEAALDGTTVVIRKKGPTSSLTQAGAVMGTPLYMAPEQHRGQVADDKADQFSFCVTLWQALCGEAPYGADTYEQLVSNVTEGRMRPVPRGIRFPSRLRSIVTRGLSASPSSRYPSMRALLAALERASRPARWPWAVAGGALAAGGVAAFLAFGGADDRDLCGGGKARLTGVWDPPRRAAIEKVFTATGSPRAAAMWQRVAGRVDRHTAGWLAHHRAVCQATHERGEQSADLLDLRMRCLDRRLADLDAVLDRFQDSPGAEVLLKADDVTASLGSFADCDDIDYLKGRVALPADPAVRARIQELEARMAEAKSYEKLGRYAQAREIATEVALAAPDLAYPPLEAESVLVRAGLEFFSGDHKAAEKSYRDAAAAAARARDDYRLAKSWIDLIQTLGAQGRHEDALELVPVARTAAERVSDDLQLSARFANNLAGIYQALGKYPEARKEYEKALALQRTIGEDNNPTLPHALNNLGTVLWHTGDLVQAKALFDEARTRLEKTFGPEHPTVAYVHRNLGDLAVLKPDLDAAIAHYRKAQSIWENVHGQDNIDVALALEPLCHALARKGGGGGGAKGRRAGAGPAREEVRPRPHPGRPGAPGRRRRRPRRRRPGRDRARVPAAGPRGRDPREGVRARAHPARPHLRPGGGGGARPRQARRGAGRLRAQPGDPGQGAGRTQRHRLLGAEAGRDPARARAGRRRLCRIRADRRHLQEGQQRPGGERRDGVAPGRGALPPGPAPRGAPALRRRRDRGGRGRQGAARAPGRHQVPPRRGPSSRKEAKEALELARAARASTDNPAFQAPIDAWLKENAR